MTNALRTRPWVLPLIASTVAAAVGVWAYHTLERSMQNLVRDEVETVLQANIAALEQWADAQRSAAEFSANHPATRRLVGELAQLADRGTATARTLLGARAQQELRDRLDPAAAQFGYGGWVLISETGANLASNTDDIVGLRVFANRPGVQAVLSGRTMLSPPFRAEIPIPQENIDQPGRPTMFVGAPVRGQRDETIAALAFRILPELDFTRVLTVGRIGQTGETYAFDAQGLMVSLSRFDDQLRRVGLLPDDTSLTALLTVEIRDPGVDMTEGFLPQLPRDQQPLTRMARAAVTGDTGSDVDGYRDYRGVPVVGAWQWMPDLSIGVTTEVDVSEAYGTLFALRRGFWALIALLIAGTAGMFTYSQVIARLQHTVRLLGQYHLEHMIGAGGLGKVYRARHAMLRRPTAIKLIRSESNNRQATARFEREVQFTAQLTHPNTIAIYDYGRTPEGVFYYAMEYLEGVTLDDLVADAGPLPEERVIYILRQACGALSEAHTAGLIHRDIKPANIMLSERGGLHDFVKVMDFGLVREINQTESGALTEVGMITGTPFYLAPETIEAPDNIDARSDLYSLGAVAYFMLAGTHMFSGRNVMEVCLHHLNTVPDPPSARLGKPVSADLESLVLRCVEKDPSKRPESTAALLELLDACGDAGKWGPYHARLWWETRAARASAAGAPAGADAASRSEPPSLVVDMKRRSP